VGAGVPEDISLEPTHTSPATSDFNMGIFTVGTARLLLGNGGEAALELTMEPWADTHRILPKQAWVVVTHSPATDGSWSGTLRGDEPFQVDHRPESVTVWVNP
jgi:hypothetical protein